MAKNTKTDNNSVNEPSKLTEFTTYLEESKAEIKKVTWPTKQEVKVTTFAVLILVTVMAVFLGVIDFGLVKAIAAITSVGR